MLQAGMVIDGKYKVLQLIGQGGMSNVYLAMNERANKKWAIKEIRQDIDQETQIVRQSFLAELELLKQLRHPHLPTVVDVIDREDSVLIVMDYIEGMTLEELRLVKGAQSQQDVIRWGTQLCDVLGYLHQREPSIIYRDMKPSNIMLRSDGNVMLIDFGTAREYKQGRTSDTVCLGTLGYAAPEQFFGQYQSDPRTDIYSLGVTLYAMLTGVDAATMQGRFEPVRVLVPGISQGLEKVLLRAMQWKVEERFTNCAEFEYALRHFYELEEVYHVSQLKVLRRFCLAVIAAVVCFVLAAQMDRVSEGKRSVVYEQMLAQAQRWEDYERTILLDPSCKDAYLAMADRMKQDYELQAEEQSVLQELRAGLIVTDDHGYSHTEHVLGQLKRSNPQGYEEVCYTFGNLELYFSDVALARDRYSNAAVWYRQIERHNKIAALYCQMADTFGNLEDLSGAKVLRAEELKEVTLCLWQQINELEEQSEQIVDQDACFLIRMEVLELVDHQLLRLADIVNQEEIDLFLNRLIRASDGNLQEQQIIDSVTAIQEKINSL